MKSKILLLSFVIFPVLTGCNSSNQVNDTEWNKAIEYLTNYNEIETLNYTMDGNLNFKFVENDGDDKDEISMSFTKLMVTNNFETLSGKIKEDDTEKDTNIYIENYGRVKKEITNLNYLYSYYVDSNEDTDGIFLNFPISYLFTYVLDLNNNKNQFSYDTNTQTYSYKSDDKLLKSSLAIKFNNKKISNANLNIQINIPLLDVEVYLNGNVNFTYGNAVEPSNEIKAKYDTIDKEILQINKDNNYKVNRTKKGMSFVAEIDLTNKDSSACPNNSFSGYNSSNSKVTYFTDNEFAYSIFDLTKQKELEISTTQNQGDFWLTDPEKMSGDTFYKNIVFNKDYVNDKLCIQYKGNLDTDELTYFAFN